MRARGINKGNITMILEVANLNIRLGESADFERAFASPLRQTNSRYTLPIKAKGLRNRDSHHPQTRYPSADERDA
jgi:hypothetical protein